MKPVLIADEYNTALPSGRPVKQSRVTFFMFVCSICFLAAAAVFGDTSLCLATALFFSLTVYFGLGAGNGPPTRDFPSEAPDCNNGLYTTYHQSPVGKECSMSGHAAPCTTVAEEYFSEVPTEFITISFRNRLERSFATDTGRRLVMGSGVINGTIGIEFHPEQRADADMDIIGCSLRLADITGQAWECRLLMLPYLLTDPIEPGAVLPPDGFSFFSEAPLSWKYAFRHSCLISGVRNMLDTRDAGELVINNISYRVFFKHQKSVIDVAYLDSRASFIVRISGLIHDVNLHGDFFGSQVLPPFCYAVPAEELLFFNAQHHYYSYHEEWYAMEDGIRKKDPLFTGIQHKATPQPLVCLTS